MVVVAKEKILAAAESFAYRMFGRWMKVMGSIPAMGKNQDILYVDSDSKYVMVFNDKIDCPENTT